jgi:hypothetical protein
MILVNTPPIVSSINRSTNSASQITTPEVQFEVTFSENVLNLDPSDFDLITDVYGASVTSVAGSGSTYMVNVSTGIGDGTIDLELLDDDSVTDMKLIPLGGLGTGNGNFAGTSPYTIKKPNLTAPVLRSPKSNAVLNNVTPTFWWSGNASYPSFEIQIASDSKFITVIETQTVNGTSHTISTPLSEGKYFWRVRVLLPSLQASKWSNASMISIDLTPPAVPQLTSPANSSTTSRKPVTFRWRNVKDAITYEFRYDNNSDCASPEYTSVGRLTSITFSTMNNGTYYWCVRAKDSAGNWSALSSSNSFTVLP